MSVTANPCLTWPIDLLMSELDETQLIVRAPGLPERVMRFVRTGRYRFESTEELSWIATDDAPSGLLEWECEPLDVQWPVRGVLSSPRWHTGNCITLPKGTIVIELELMYRVVEPQDSLLH